MKAIESSKQSFWLGISGQMTLLVFLLSIGLFAAIATLYNFWHGTRTELAWQVRGRQVIEKTALLRLDLRDLQLALAGSGTKAPDLSKYANGHFVWQVNDISTLTPRLQEWLARMRTTAAELDEAIREVRGPEIDRPLTDALARLDSQSAELMDSFSLSRRKKMPDDMLWQDSAEFFFLLLRTVLLLVLTSVSTFLIARRIASRIGVLLDNTQKLAAGQELAPPLKGADEFQRLDQAFRSMAFDLQRLDRLKQEFVAIVSHELRTPLSSLRAFLPMLGRGDFGELNEEGLRHVRRMDSDSRRLIGLVNNLLDSGKLELGHFQLDLDVTSLGRIVASATDTVRFMAQDQNITININIADQMVVADYERTVQVLINLLTNAIRYSPKDSAIDVTSEVENDAVRIRVTDQGPGVPSDQLEVIFDRFHTVEESTHKRKGSTGLGLAIAREIVERQKGKIGVINETPKGSTFWFTLPLAES